MKQQQTKSHEIESLREHVKGEFPFAISFSFISKQKIRFFSYFYTLLGKSACQHS